MKGTRNCIVIVLCLLLPVSLWAAEQQKDVLEEVDSKVKSWLEAAKLGPFAPAEEAGPIPLMARSATTLVHLEEYGVRIAVDTNFPDLLHVSRRLAFDPQLVA